MTKKVFYAILFAAVVTAIVAAYFFFPDAVRPALSKGAAIAVQSWNDTFHGSRSDPVLTLDLTARSTVEGDAAVSSTNTTDAGREAAAAPSESPPASNAPPSTILSTESSTVPAAPDYGTIANLAAAVDASVSTTPLVGQCAISTSASVSRKIILNEI